MPDRDAVANYTLLLIELKRLRDFLDVHEAMGEAIPLEVERAFGEIERTVDEMHRSLSKPN